MYELLSEVVQAINMPHVQSMYSNVVTAQSSEHPLPPLPRHALLCRGSCLIGLLMQEQHALFAQYLRRAYMVPVALGRWLGRSGLVTKHWRFNPSTQAAFQAQAVMGFYDTWVARCCSSLFLLTYTGLYFCIGLVHSQGSYCNGVIESCRGLRRQPVFEGLSLCH